MALTNTPIPIPSQFSHDLKAPDSPAESEWDEALEAVKDLLPSELWVNLSDACGTRSLAAYEFGARWGLGQFPDVDSCMDPRELFDHLQEALDRIGPMLDSLRKEIR
jgi:hypothetical protein